MKKDEERDKKLALAFCLALVGLLVISMIMGWLVASIFFHNIIKKERLLRDREKYPSLYMVPVVDLTKFETPGHH